MAPAPTSSVPPAPPSCAWTTTRRPSRPWSCTRATRPSATRTPPRRGRARPTWRTRTGPPAPPATPRRTGSRAWAPGTTSKVGGPGAGLIPGSLTALSLLGALCSEAAGRRGAGMDGRLSPPGGRLERCGPFKLGDSSTELRATRRGTPAQEEGGVALSPSEGRTGRSSDWP